jgi:hypothetical protein
MKVFHGSDMRIEKVDLSKSKDFKDFGKGFYVTPIYEHAHKWAVRVAEDSDTYPVVTEFEYHERNIERRDLKVKRFLEISEEWALFVVKNREEDTEQPTHDYDIVEGPIANDWVTSQIKKFKKNKISIEQLLERLQYREDTYQICFCTPESLFALEQIGYDDIYNTEEITNNIIEVLIIDYDMDEKTAMDKFYLTELYTRLANNETGLHTKPWQEIYEMLKQELNILE